MMRCLSRVLPATGRGLALIPAVSAIALLTAPALPATAATGPTAPPRYALTVLPTLGAPFDLSAAIGINDIGWIVGDTNEPTSTNIGNATQHETLWRNGTITDLGALCTPNPPNPPSCGPNSLPELVAKPNDTGLLSGSSQDGKVDPLNEQWTGGVCDVFGDLCAGSQYELRGFVWRDGVMRPLPTLGGNNAAAFGVANSQGEVVGTAETALQDPNCVSTQVLDYKPVVWAPDRQGNYGIRELPEWPGDRIGAGLGINVWGQVVGGSGPCGPPGGGIGVTNNALLWQHGTTINLGSLGGKCNNLATAINDRGQVAGLSDVSGNDCRKVRTNNGGAAWMYNGSTAYHAFLWQNGVMTDLGTLPGDMPPDTFSYPEAINDAGQVVGQSCNTSGTCRAFLWQNGAMTDLNAVTDLNTPDGPFDLANAWGINDQGDIVGIGGVSPSQGLAFEAIPCDNLPPADPRCSDAAQGTASTARPSFALPESGPGMLGSRPGIGIGVGLFGGQPRGLW